MSYWFNELPSDWNVVKVKNIFNIINGGTPKSDIEEYWSDSEVIWVTPEDLSKEGKYLDDSIRKISNLGLQNCSANLIKANSIVLSTRAPIGNVKVSTVTFTTNQGCKSLEAKDKVNITYYYYVLAIAKEHLNNLGQGTTFLELSNYSLKNVFVPYPDINLQDLIAYYLDTKCNQIDKLIVAKKKQISLLEQQRQSIITEAVTRGLNPNVKMKDSGVEWIGEIPEHWEVKPLYSLYKENKLKNKRNVITNVLSLSYGKIKRRDVESNYGLLPDSFETYQIIQKDDIVLRLTDLQNDKRSLRVGLVNEEGIITSAYLGLKQSDKSISEYTYYLLHSYDLTKVFYGLGSGVRQSMGFTELKKLPILLPPIEEQLEIINQLKVKVFANEQLIDMLKTQIEKLKEYRQSLIYEAVTGKIDVREMEREVREVSEDGCGYVGEGV